MKYKVGDKVRIKNFDWYNENKNKFGKVWCANGHIPFDKDMSKYCGKVLTIRQVLEEYKQYLVIECGFTWTDDMIEGLIEENITIDVAVEETTKDISDKVVDTLMGGLMVGKSFNLPQGYQFKDENGNVINATKIVLEKKEYPKTYEECCKVMGVNHTNDLDICEHCDYKTEITYYEDSLLEKIEALYRLIICRDAYWKIAGEEMGLGKPWEPDFDNLSTNLEYIKIVKGCFTYSSRVFAFPTPEMRDAFKENFDKDIEFCKELL